MDRYSMAILGHRATLDCLVGKRILCLSFSPLESREVHERRGRCKPFGDAASIDCRGASPVVPTDPPQAEGNMRKRRDARKRVTIA